MNKEELINILKERFEKYPIRHPKLSWSDVEEKLTDDKCDILIRMEETEGEPDAIVMPDGSLAYMDCAAEAPKMRRSLCYDRVAWNLRKANKPAGSVEEMAEEIGAEILDEADYMFLQSLGDFDLKSQVWIKTAGEFRAKGEALFGNKRNNRTFIYYNGAESYYGVRGFRCKLKL